MSDTKWSNKQLLLEAESIVVGRYGVDTTYKVLQGLRDDMQAAIDELEAKVTRLTAALMAADEALLAMDETGDEDE